MQDRAYRTETQGVNMGWGLKGTVHLLVPQPEGGFKQKTTFQFRCSLIWEMPNKNKGGGRREKNETRGQLKTGGGGRGERRV